MFDSYVMKSRPSLQGDVTPQSSYVTELGLIDSTVCSLNCYWITKHIKHMPNAVHSSSTMKIHFFPHQTL